MKRIGIDAHYVGFRHGGGEHFTQNFIRGLAALEPGEEEYFLFNYRNQGEKALPGAPFRLEPLRRKSTYAQRAWEIPRASARLGLDILHVPFNVLPVGRSRKILSIYDLAFLHAGNTFNRAERLRMDVMTRFSVKHADHIVTISDYSRRDIAAQFGYPESRITVAHCAIDPAEFRPWPEVERRAFRADKALPDRFLLFVGTLQPRKNVVNLLKAFAELARTDRDTHLILVGRKGWIYESIFAFIREKDLGARVRHFDAVDPHTLLGLYNTAAGLVFPSIFEGFGMPILEAMGCGCPVASSNATSMPEVYGDAALSFDPNDIGAMADSMRTLALDERTRAELASKGAANCSRFSWEKSAREIRKVYRTL